MNLTKIFRTVSVFLVATLGIAFQSHAAVTATFSAGATCGGATSALFSPGGVPVQVSLCMTTTAPSSTCGHTIVLQSAAGESGRFVVTTTSLGSNYSDPNSEVSQLPLAINNPPTVADFGGTGSAPVAPATNQLLATFTLAPQSSATNASYAVSLATVSTVAVDADGTCGATTVPTELPITASFTLTRNNAPVFTSANAATFSTASANSFTVTATGNPAPTLSLTSGTLPSGVTFNGGTGVLQGTPTATGTFNLVFTASNGTSTPQNFTLTTAGQASQTINFTNPGAQTFSSTPFAVTATASSGLTVTFSSQSPAICTVSGNNVTMLALGTCTIAANQAGNATFLAAPTVTQSFGISGTVPGAPTIGTAIAGNSQATISFTPPTSTGGSPITSYTATCGGISASGSVSPITVGGLTNGVSYSCTVTATNALGTGASSGSVSVMPSASVPLTLIGVQSRKVHANGTGAFDVPINFNTAANGAVDTEPRQIGSGHIIVFQFNQPITVAGAVSLTDASATLVGGIGTAAAPVVSMTNNNEVLVTITGTLDNRRVTVGLTGVNGSGGGTPTIGFLVGDVDNTRAVNIVDISGVRARSGQTTTSANFRWDVDMTGAINVVDISAVRQRSGLALP